MARRANRRIPPRFSAARGLLCRRSMRTIATSVTPHRSRAARARAACAVLLLAASASLARADLEYASSGLHALASAQVEGNEQGLEDVEDDVPAPGELRDLEVSAAATDTLGNDVQFDVFADGSVRYASADTFVVHIVGLRRGSDTTIGSPGGFYEIRLSYTLSFRALADGEITVDEHFVFVRNNTGTFTPLGVALQSGGVSDSRGPDVAFNERSGTGGGRETFAVSAGRFYTFRIDLSMNGYGSDARQGESWDATFTVQTPPLTPRQSTTTTTMVGGPATTTTSVEGPATTTTVLGKPTTTTTTLLDGPPATTTTLFEGPATTTTTVGEGPATTTTTIPEGPATTTTTTPDGPPTTTTLPAPEGCDGLARADALDCWCAAGLGPAACLEVSLPPPLAAAFTRGCAQRQQALEAPPAKMRRSLRRSRASFRRAARLAKRAASQDDLSADCAAALRAIVGASR